MPTEEIFVAALRVQDSLPSSSVPPSTKVSALVVTRESSKPSGKRAASGKSRNPSLHASILGRCHIPLKNAGRSLESMDGCFPLQGEIWGLLHSFQLHLHLWLPHPKIFRLPSLRLSSHISRPLVLSPCTLCHRLPLVSLRWPAASRLMPEGMHLL